MVAPQSDHQDPTVNTKNRTVEHGPTSVDADRVRALLEEHADPATMPSVEAWAHEWQATAEARAEADAERVKAAAAGDRIAAAKVLDIVTGAMPEADPNDVADALAAEILGAGRRKIGRTARDLLATVPEEPNWLIPGLAARGWAVKIAAREKTGKGTLMYYLLGCLERGEATVFGEPTAPASALVLSEEPEDSTREKVARAGLAEACIVYGWELVGLPWEEKVDTIVALAVEGGHGILFVDNVSRAAGVEDEAGTELARRAEYLFDRAKAAGLTTFIDHHHRKAAGKTEDKSRGGTALAGATDNNVELERVTSDWTSRVRRLSARGRLTVTNWERTVALSEDGQRFESVADSSQPQGGEQRRRLRALVDAGDAGVTAPTFALAIGKKEDTARRVLGEFVAEGWAEATGGKPVTYTATEKGREASSGTGGAPDALDF